MYTQLIRVTEHDMERFALRCLLLKVFLPCQLSTLGLWNCCLYFPDPRLHCFFPLSLVQLVQSHSNTSILHLWENRYQSSRKVWLTTNLIMQLCACRRGRRGITEQMSDKKLAIIHQLSYILTELCSPFWILIPSISSASFFKLGVPPYVQFQGKHVQLQTSA